MTFSWERDYSTVRYAYVAVIRCTTMRCTSITGGLSASHVFLPRNRCLRVRAGT